MAAHVPNPQAPQPAPPPPAPPSIRVIHGGKIVQKADPNTPIGQAFVAAMNALQIPPHAHARVPLILNPDGTWMLQTPNGQQVNLCAQISDPNVTAQLQQIATQALGIQAPPPPAPIAGPGAPPHPPAQPPAGAPQPAPPQVPIAGPGAPPPALAPQPPPPAPIAGPGAPNILQQPAPDISYHYRNKLIAHVQGLLPQLRLIYDQFDNKSSHNAISLSLFIQYFDPLQAAALSTYPMPTLIQATRDIMDIIRAYLQVQFEKMSAELQNSIQPLIQDLTLHLNRGLLADHLDAYIHHINSAENHLSSHLRDAMDQIARELRNNLQMDLSPTLQALKTELQSPPTLKRLREIDQEIIAELAKILREKNEESRHLICWQRPYAQAINGANQTRADWIQESQNISQALIQAITAAVPPAAGAPAYTYQTAMTALLRASRARLNAERALVEKFAPNMPETTAQEAAAKYKRVRSEMLKKLTAVKDHPAIANGGAHSPWNQNQANINSPDFSNLIIAKNAFEHDIHATQWRWQRGDLFA